MFLSVNFQERLNYNNFKKKDYKFICRAGTF